MESNDIFYSKDVILMRKNPPFDLQFVYITYILEFLYKNDVLIINNPKSLRDYNEKISTLSFKYAPKTLITCKKQSIYLFQEEVGDIILKPLNNMGGASVFYLKKNDVNTSVIIDNLTNYQNNFCMIQEYIADIIHGDRRIIIINGIPIPRCLVRIPIDGEIRGNLAAGAIYEIQNLRKIDYDIISKINITSPTGVREIESAYPISISSILLDNIENILNKKHFKEISIFNKI
uniref:Prokaryotic glutathione synthetase ATP-binding domain-containing protein n=1 Tax=Glossina palpalis gambiensis TaxID=67801 RepID=A0A1B0C7J2_9MUSC